jgi:hypothetical protein
MGGRRRPRAMNPGFFMRWGSFMRLPFSYRIIPGRLSDGLPQILAMLRLGDLGLLEVKNAGFST